MHKRNNTQRSKYKYKY